MAGGGWLATLKPGRALGKMAGQENRQCLPHRGGSTGGQLGDGVRGGAKLGTEDHLPPEVLIAEKGAYECREAAAEPCSSCPCPTVVDDGRAALHEPVMRCSANDETAHGLRVNALDAQFAPAVLQEDSAVGLDGSLVDLRPTRGAEGDRSLQGPAAPDRGRQTFERRTSSVGRLLIGSSGARGPYQKQMYRESQNKGKEIPGPHSNTR